jgi:hypothetical protein
VRVVQDQIVVAAALAIVMEELEEIVVAIEMAVEAEEISRAWTSCARAHVQ